MYENGAHEKEWLLERKLEVIGDPAKFGLHLSFLLGLRVWGSSLTALTPLSTLSCMPDSANHEF